MPSASEGIIAAFALIVVSILLKRNESGVKEADKHGLCMQALQFERRGEVEASTVVNQRGAEIFQRERFVEVFIEVNRNLEDGFGRVMLYHGYRTEHAPVIGIP